MDLSVTFNEEGALFKCHHCFFAGKVGNIVSTSKANYRKPGYKPSDDLDPVVKSYFASRGITEEVLRRNKIGYVKTWMPDEGETGAFAFPYLRDGSVVNVKYRTVNKSFKMERGAELCLYGIDDIAGDTLMYVEGEIDKLSAEVAGFTSCVSVPNGSPGENVKNFDNHLGYLANTPQLKGIKKFIIATDNDGPGDGLKKELIRRLGPEKCWSIAWPENTKDFNEVLVKCGPAFLKDLIENAEPVIPRLKIKKLSDKYVPPPPELVFNTPRGEIVLLQSITNRGKALALDTPIPTPSGWSTQGELKVGDMVFDERGIPCKVVAESPIWEGRPCYEVELSSGEKIVADQDHEWLTHTIASKRSAYNSDKYGSVRKVFPSVVTTKQIANSLTLCQRNVRYNHFIELAAPIQLPEVELPIDPYCLGAWLGDGHTKGGRITCADAFIIDEFRKHYDVTNGLKSITFGIKGLQSLLRSTGLFGNKHIPMVYLRASVNQRLALLQGLMDTDGTVDSQGRCELSLCNKELAFGAQQLISSLGIKCTIYDNKATLYGKIVNRRWRISFVTTENVFRLPRKLCRLPSVVRNNNVAITSCKPTKSVKVKCIQVDSPNHLYLVGKHYTPTHNSTILRNASIRFARGEEFLCLNHDPSFKKRVLIVNFEFGDPTGDLKKMLNGQSDCDNIRIIDAPRFGDVDLNLSNYEHFKFFREACQEAEADVIVIDTYAASFAVANENDNAEATKNVKILRGLARDCQAVVILSHHLGKMKPDDGVLPQAYRGRGASALPGGAASIFNLDADKDDLNLVTLTCAKNKSGLGEYQIGLVLDPETRWFSPMSEAAPLID